MIKGKLIVDEFGNGFVNSVEPNLTVYIPKSNMSFAYPNADVEVEIISSANNLYYGKIVNFQIVGKTFVGQVHHMYISKSIPYAFVYVSKLGKSNMVNIRADPNLNLKKGMHVQIQIDLIGLDQTNQTNPTNPTQSKQTLSGSLLEILSSDIDDLIETEFELTKYDLPSDNITQMINMAVKTNPKPINRRDLTDHDVFTIDPLTCTDCDDAFSIKKIDNLYHIYVHIADLTEHISPSDPEFEKIMLRSNTYYGSKRSWTMIPETLASNLCSILPNKKTNVITTEFVYDEKAQRIDFVEYFYSQIESKNKYDYDWVDQNFDSNYDFHILKCTSDLIQKELSELPMNSESASHQMVKNWMIKVNLIMGDIVHKIFRTHKEPQQKHLKILNKLFNHHKLNQLSETDQSPHPSSNRQLLISNINKIINDQNQSGQNHTYSKMIYYLIKSSQSRASYTISDNLPTPTNSNPTYHYGLGVSSYTHWTSPIRRFADLLSHLILRGYEFTDQQMNIYLAYITEGELKQTLIENYLIKHKDLSLYLNKQLSTYIIDIKPTGINLYITDFDTTYWMHVSKLSSNRLRYETETQTLTDGVLQYQMFDKVNINLSKYNSITSETEYDLVRS